MPDWETAEKAARVRAARAYSGMTQVALAGTVEHTRVTYDVLREIERGNRTAHPEELRAIGTACRVPRTFMDVGWAPMEEPITDTERRLHDLEAQLARHSKALDELRAGAATSGAVDPATSPTGDEPLRGPDTPPPTEQVDDLTRRRQTSGQ